jgi:hypothetical protein
MNTRSSSANDCLENDGQPGKVKLHFVGVKTLFNAADDIDKNRAHTISALIEEGTF